MNIEDYRAKFATLESVSFTEGPGFPLVHIRTRFCEVLISLLGGQVLSYQPTGQAHDLLFRSRQAHFEIGKGIKGGIPVCWPWFGEHPEGHGMHGFARSCVWQINRLIEDDCGVVEIELGLPQPDAVNDQWVQTADLALSIRCGKWLSLGLRTLNTSDQPLVLSQALHTYFAISDISSVHIEGLESRSYLDKVQHFKRCDPSRQPIAVQQEVDRIYEGTAPLIKLVDPQWQRQIEITAQNSASTVVWNPWIEKARLMADFADDEYHSMICIETANAASDARLLAPGTEHQLAVTYRVTAL